MYIFFTMGRISKISPNEAGSIRKVIWENDHTPTSDDYLAIHYGYYRNIAHELFVK